jgi:hypothetical protein
MMLLLKTSNFKVEELGNYRVSPYYTVPEMGVSQVKSVRVVNHVYDINDETKDSFTSLL